MILKKIPKSEPRDSYKLDSVNKKKRVCMRDWLGLTFIVVGS